MDEADERAIGQLRQFEQLRVDVVEVDEADERAIRQLRRFGQLRGMGWRWMRQLRGRLGN